MAENKTKPTAKSVQAYIGKITDPDVRKDCNTIISIMEAVTKQKPVMWGTAIVGFGSYHYVYESGREGDMPVVAFSARKQAITLYLCGGLELFKAELPNLGKYTNGKGCLYIKSLDDVNTAVLKKIITKSFKSRK